MLCYLICISLVLYVTNAAVQKFVAQSFLVQDHKAVGHRNAVRNKHLMRELSSHKLEPSLSLDWPYVNNHTYYYIYITNITIGTPAQTYAMEVDLFHEADLSVLGPNANLSQIQDNVPPKHIFYPGNSSSYVDLNGTFRCLFYGRGHNASDKVTVDQISTKISLGILDDLIFDNNFFTIFAIDGIMGLNPTTPETNANNLVSQLVADLDTPIMSWWQNQSWSGGTAQLTLGGEDTDNCQSNFVYVPQLWYRSNYGYSYGGFRVHLASAHIGDAAEYSEEIAEVTLNTTLSMYSEQSRIYCNHDFLYILTNASNAVYNSTTEEWEVDCDVTKAKNVTLNIGGTGDDGADLVPLVLTGADYIGTMWPYKSCFVAAYPYDWSDAVVLSTKFMNNHCIAYNAKEQTIGFADAKWINKSPKS